MTDPEQDFGVEKILNFLKKKICYLLQKRKFTGENNILQRMKMMFRGDKCGKCPHGPSPGFAHENNELLWLVISVVDTRP